MWDGRREYLGRTRRDCQAATRRARAIAEALKREAYKFAAEAAPYVEAGADARLDAEREKIEDDGDDLIAQLVTHPGKGSVPRQKLTQQQYVERRVDDQIDFYTKRAGTYRTAATWLHGTEFALALAATLITAVASVTGKSTHVLGIQFDIAALTAVLTTVAGAVLAHVEASRFDFWSLPISPLPAGWRTARDARRPPSPIS